MVFFVASILFLLFAGDNSDKLCQLCASKVPGQRCTSADPYAGYEGAFRCLVEAGDIAFLKHTTVASVLSIGSTFSKKKNIIYYIISRFRNEMNSVSSKF